MTAVLLVYGGGVFALAGLVSLLNPMSFGLKKRIHATVVVGCGLLIALVGFALPASQILAWGAQS